MKPERKQAVFSPLRYPGGKRRLATKICELIPEFGEFREPFVGGGSVFFQLKQEFPGRMFWINDRYSELATFWKNSQTDLENVLIKIKEWRYKFSDGKALFYFLKENKKRFDDVEMAAMFFVFNRITFSGTTEAGGYSEQAFQGRFTESSIERLSKIGGVLENVKITNNDYAELIVTSGEDVFLYLDPPYSDNIKSALYGKGGKLHKGFDHVRLANLLKKCPHKWLLTYDNSSRIHKLYSFANIANWDLTYGMRNVSRTNSLQKEKELFITNYETAETRA